MTATETTKLEDLKKDFLSLNRLAQLELMQYCLEVFATKPVSKEEEAFMLTDEWKMELNRRSKEVESGTVKLLDNDKVLAQLGL